MDEVLRRVAARFPLAIIDRARADQKVRDHLIDLEGLSAHTVILESWRALEGRVAYVTVREVADGPHFEFFITDQPSSIDIDYEYEDDREVCRPLLEDLAAALPEYDLVSEDPEAQPDLTPDDVPAALREAIPEMHVRWDGEVAIVAAGPHDAGEPFPQENASRHWSDDSTKVILDLTGFARVPSHTLIEWAQDVCQTVQSRGNEFHLCSPPGTIDERITRYFQLVGVPTHATLAEAVAACPQLEE
jgi:hypothetical protein